MSKQKRGGQSGKKGGSIIDDPIETPVKHKPKKQKKQSKGKQKH